MVGVIELGTLDISPPVMKKICNITFEQQDIDTLQIETFFFTQAEHQLFPKDFIVIFVERLTTDELDDWSRSANFLGVRLVWDITVGL